MKFIDDLQHLIKNPEEKQEEVFVALVVDQSFLQGVSFELHGHDTPRIHAVATEVADHPTWEERLLMADKIFAKLEDGDGEKTMTKVVFGLGSSFLTKEGDIEKAIRPHLKDMTKKLGLTPLGFVPLTTGIAHYLKRIEGVPPSVIIVHVGKDAFAISIFRVGRLASEIMVKRTESPQNDIEDALKSEQNEEVLPSRILLVGADLTDIDEVKTILLKHQWTSRANFLHYPKVDVFPGDDVARAIADAGAGELTKTFEKNEEEPTELIATETMDEKKFPTEEIDTKKEILPETESLDIEKALEERLKGKKEIEQEKEIHEEILVEKEPLEEKEFVEVEPETLGFFKEGAKETLASVHETKVVDTLENEPERPKRNFLSIMMFRGKLMVKKILHTMRSGKFFFIPIVGILLIAILSWIFITSMRKVTISVEVLPKELSTTEIISIDAGVATVSTEKKTIPGTKIERTVSGEKTIPSTGTKKIGDPAKGTVIISNKTVSPKTFKKGAVLMSGTVRFTLSEDVLIASASEDFRGSTWGTGTVGVVAETIGPDGNLPANTKFTFKDFDSDIAVARNEQPFTGGTSKEVTVVSRADYDLLLKTLTAELVEEAKTELSRTVTGKERLVESTIKTTVKEKVYREEIDQEAKELHGKLTIIVSAISFSEDDVITLLSTVAGADVPDAYAIDSKRTTVTVGEVKTDKTGKMSAQAAIVSIALPTFDIDELTNRLVGKSLSEAQNELKSIPGIASIEFMFSPKFFNKRLPNKAKAITIVIVPQ